MNNKSIIIAENSYLLRQGLIQSIDQLDIKANIYDCDDIDQVIKRMAVFYIHYAFINPEIAGNNFSTILELKTENPAVVFIGLLENEESMNKSYFDHVLFLKTGKSEVQKKLSHIFKQNKTREHANNSNLSEREKTILTRVARGRTNQEIAEELFISTHTVISHRKNITRKLGIKTVAGLAVYAVINNLADANDLK